uniref:Uncharacterized protein n=1 Tax=Setaria italica TaxID=4555 RepID=K4AHF1_SETIT
MSASLRQVTYWTRPASCVGRRGAYRRLALAVHPDAAPARRCLALAVGVPTRRCLEEVAREEVAPRPAAAWCSPLASRPAAA